MTEIARFFENGKNASNAADELTANNFPNVRISSGPTGPMGNAKASKRDMNVGTGPSADGRLRNGGQKADGAVLRVDVPFGRGRLAEQIIDRHGPSKPLRSDNSSRAGKPPRRVTAGDIDEDAKAAPLSSLLNLPVLTDSRPTTVGSLGDQRPTFPTGLLRSDFYVSRLLGLPLLTESKAWASIIHNPAPLSTWLGIPVLIQSRPPDQVDPQPTSLDASEPA